MAMQAEILISTVWVDIVYCVEARSQRCRFRGRARWTRGQHVHACKWAASRGQQAFLQDHQSAKLSGRPAGMLADRSSDRKIGLVGVRLVQGG
jgi:hypothetical protein